jgi:hypothetical protein
LVVRTRISNPAVPQRNNRIRRNPYTSVSRRAKELSPIERHTSLHRAHKQERVQDGRLLNEGPSPVIEVVEVVLHSLRQRRSRRVEFDRGCLSSTQRLRGKRRIEQEGLGCYARDEDLDDDGNGGFEVRALKRGDVEELDEKEVQEAAPEAAPEDDDVDTCCEKGTGNLDLCAVEQEAVTQRRIGLVRGVARAQEVRGYGKGENFDADVRRGGQARDLVKGGEEVRKRRVCEDRERRDIVDYLQR